LNRSDAENPDVSHLDANEIDENGVIEAQADNPSPVNDVELPVTEAVAHTDAAPEMVAALAEPESVIDVQAPVPIEKPDFWQRVRSVFAASPSDRVARLTQLTRAIEDAPEAAVNYVLRGELYMDMREYALAHVDFQRAYEVAEAHFEIADWGFMEQVMRDRALAGLDKARRRLK